jgi:hypothetical protein
MANAADFVRLALALPDSVEYPHFDRRAFRAHVTFATLSADGASANLKFSPEEQEFKCRLAPDAFAPIANAWGRLRANRRVDHLYSDGERPPLSGGDHRLGQPRGAGLAAVEYDGYAFLPRRAGGGVGATRNTSDIQHRSRRAQFTSAAFTGKLQAAGIAISMDGRGRFMDNIFIERLWRSIKWTQTPHFRINHVSNDL